MASRAVVFRPINSDDVSNTPFEANTTFKYSNIDDSLVIRHGLHNNQITPISASNLSTDNPKNADGTYQTPIWKSIDHLFYKPDFKYEPNRTFEHYNARYTEKNLFYSCSIIGIPYIYSGENIKRTSFKISGTGSYGNDKFDLYDDKYGNLRDRLIDSSSFASNQNLVGYWGFNDEFRHFELNFGTLGGNYTRGVESKQVFPSHKNKSSELNTTAYKVKYEGGITTTGIDITDQISNGDFAGGTTGWTINTTAAQNQNVSTAVVDGQLVITSLNASNSYGLVTQPVTFTKGNTYEVKFTVVSITNPAGTGYKYIRIGTNHSAAVGTGNTRIFGFDSPYDDAYSDYVGVPQVIIYKPTTDYSHLQIGARNDVTELIIDNISVKDVTPIDSGISAGFTSQSNAYIITENDKKFNFRNDEDYAISFWCRLPEHQAYSSSKVTSNPIITKRGTERVPTRVIRNGKQFVEMQNENITRTRFPYDISVTNHESSYPAGKLLFRRSQGTTTLETTSSTCITGSDWHHIVCQKSGSSRAWGDYSNLEVYVNGTRESEIPDPFHFERYANTMNPSHLLFGALNIDNSNLNKLSGSIDEVRIYDRALKVPEITSLSNNHYYSSSAYQSSVAGNVFYRSGQVVISSPLPKYHAALQDKFNIEYKSARTIYENEVLVKVPKADCNVSMNPSLRKPKSQLIQNQFTGSAWKPYITTIGLYNDSAELIAVAKLGRAVQKRDDVDMNFIIRWDY